MKRKLFSVGAAAAILGLYAACSDNPTVAPKPGLTPGATPTFAEAVASNGTAHACMGDDGLTAPTGYVSANLLSGHATFPSFGCTANDIDIASTTVTEFSLTGEPGSFVPLASGARIECTPGQTVFVHTFAQLENNAQSRYDIGVWIADPIDASAMSVGDGTDHNCRHYNLILSASGVSNLEVTGHQDACGDMAQGTGLATLDLEVLQVTCPSNATTVSVNSCIGWQNSDDFNDRGFCPASFPNPGTAQEFRWGTLPETGSKCNCTPFALPIDVKASLTLVKTITNDDGGTATINNFPLTATGPRTISGISGSTDVTGHPVDAGTYALSETTVANYTAGLWSCSGNGTLSGSNLTLAAGGVATCVINNNDNPSHLTLVKTVTNDNGGTATTANFPLTAAGPSTISGTSGSGSVTNAAVSAGSYNLSETTVANYTAGAWSCSNGGGAGSQVTVAFGSSVTCTINNNDNQSTLTLVKTVTNDNGGTATTANFPLTATGPSTISGTSGSGSVTNVAVNAGSYNLSETTVANYTAGAWSCSNGGGAGSQVTVAFGSSVTCTINNNDNQSHLTLVKTVTNDNGGTKTTADFPLTAIGPSTISGTSGSGSVTNAAVNAGLYALSEQAQANYTAGAWSCSNGGGAGSQVTVAFGSSVTCTINNNDNASSLTLVKTVTNDNGGTATTANFPLTATGPSTISGTSGSGSVTNAAVNAGSYSLSETTVANYTAGSWSCSNGGGAGSQVTVVFGTSVTCTINNNDNPSHLTLVKTVTNDNGGTKTTADFPLTAIGPSTISGTSGSGSVTNAAVNAGSYNLSETTVANYTAGPWVCSNGGGAGSQVTVVFGTSVTCTINNDDNLSHLTLVKTVTNDNGGTATTANFPLTAAGPSTISGTSGSGSVTNAAVNAGSYNLSETTVANYTAGSWSCSNGGGAGGQVTIALASSVTCTINNNDNPSHLTLVKTVTNDNGGTATTADFPLRAAGPSTISGTSGSGAVTNAAVNAGLYNLSETTVANYTAGAWSCSNGGGGSSQVTVAFGSSVTCTINNNDNPATLTLVKHVIGVGGTTFDFTLTGTGLPGTQALTPASDASSQAVYNNLSAGTKSITELLPNANYILTDIGCVRPPSTTPFVTGNTTTGLVSVNLTIGDNVVCTYVNQRTSQTTRTQGFWAAHPQVSNVIWFGGTLNGQSFGGVADKTLCSPVTKDINTLAKLMGGFWASIPFTTSKDKRSDIDAARMRLLQQLLAAMLNNAAFGSSPSGGISIAQAEAAYCGSDIDAIKAAAAAMGAFNESGDTGLFDPGLSADPKFAKSIADLAFWNLLP